jgi:replicative DNA helicase
MTDTLLKKLKEGTVKPEEVLYPEKKLSSVNVDNLKVEVIDSGFATLNKFKVIKKNKSELIVIGARPSVGKSSLMFQIAENMAVNGGKILVFSLEMDLDQILTRSIAQKTDLTINHIQDGKIQREALLVQQEFYDKIDLHIIDQSGLDVQTIALYAEDYKRRNGIDLVVIDYLQLIKKTKGHSTSAEVGEITWELKMLAKKLKCPVMVGSQLNRKSDFRSKDVDDNKPRASDLRDSGSIEQDADVVVLLHDASPYDKEADPNERDIIIAKNRNGPKGEYKCRYYGAQCKFVDPVKHEGL